MQRRTATLIRRLAAGTLIASRMFTSLTSRPDSLWSVCVVIQKVPITTNWPSVSSRAIEKGIRLAFLMPCRQSSIMTRGELAPSSAKRCSVTTPAISTGTVLASAHLIM